MKIVRCSKCGHYIHKADKCFHCGNTMGFDETKEVVIHENIVREYSYMETLIAEKKFEEALSLSSTVLEWMPNLAGAFWLRLLAKNKCTTAIELISKGFSCDDEDFYNALKFSVEEERIAYEDIQKSVVEISDLLKKKVIEHEYKCKHDTSVVQLKKTIQDEVDSRQKILFELWSELEAIEHSMIEVEMDCRLLTKEYQIGLERSLKSASAIKSEIYKMEECTAETLHSLQVKLGHVLQKSESSKDSLESMKKQHPWVKAFSDLVAQRNQKVEAINSEVESLKSYERTIRQVINEIKRIEIRHKTALRKVEKYDFSEAVDLLGTDTFDQIMRDCGIGVGSSINVFYEGGKLTTYDNNTKNSETDDEIDMEDYLAAWGLTEE